MFRRYALHECRDSACRRPFGVRLRGNGWFHRSLLHDCAAPLRMTRRVMAICGDIIHSLQCYFNQCYNVTLTDSYCTTTRKNPPAVSFQSKRLRRSVEPRRGAGRRNLGTRVRHRYQTHSRPQIKREAAPCKELAPPAQTKNFPQEHPHKSKANQIFALQRRVLLGEVLGRSGRFGG